MVLILLVGLFLIYISYILTRSNIHRLGYVYKEETAINIAVSVWSEIYGKEMIEKEKPYKATLKNGTWYVTGSLPEGMVGGVAEAEIAKDDGRIIRVTHGK